MRHSLLIILLLLSWGLSAQGLSVIVGQVMDEKSAQPVANVNIVLQGTGVGTTTNAEGLFCLKAELSRSHTMVVSCVGYETQRFTIAPGQQAGVDIYLKEKVSHMADVVVSPGTNPALPLMERVRAYRALNDHPYPMEQAHMYIQLFATNFHTRLLMRKLNNQPVDSVKNSDGDIIPMYSCAYYGDRIQEQAVMLDAPIYTELLDGIHGSANFYRNTIDVLGASVLSPLASASSIYYRFYLADSTEVDGRKHYMVHFRTRNAFYATLNGEMEIDSASCALCQMDVQLPMENNINYLRDLRIHQSFSSDGKLIEERTSLILDAAIKRDTSHTFPTLLLTRHVLFDSISSMVVPMMEKMSADSGAFAAADTLPLFRFIKFASYVVHTGYFPTNTKVEIGKLTEALHITPQEGVRFGLPLRTSQALWKNVSLEGFVAYGVKDRAVKGAGEVHVNLPCTLRHQIHVRYGDEYVISDVNEYGRLLRENSAWSSQMSVLTSWLQGAVTNRERYYNFNVRRREGKIWFEDEWNPWLETQSYVKAGRMGCGEPTTNYSAQPSFFYSTVGAIGRISFGERKVDLYFRRKHMYNHRPVIFLGAEVGSYQLAQQPYRMYGNVHVMMRHLADFGMGGELDYVLQAGMVFGKVPYPLLHIMPGNQTYSFDVHRFSLMNNYQYAADRYVALQAQWNGKGILFNCIPGVRWLKLRELLEMKVAWGGLSHYHRDVLAFPTAPYTMQSLDIPYVEVGVGIGNILRFGELYSIWRVTHLHDSAAPYWALKFSFSLGL